MGRAKGTERPVETGSWKHAGITIHSIACHLTMPVFIGGSKYDGIAPASSLEARERQIPNARLVFFEGGHLFLREDRRAIQRVIAFLQAERDNEDG